MKNSTSKPPTQPSNPYFLGNLADFNTLPFLILGKIPKWKDKTSSKINAL